MDDDATVLVAGGPVRWAVRSHDAIALTLAKALHGAMGDSPMAETHRIGLSCDASVSWHEAVADALRSAGTEDSTVRLPAIADDPESVGNGLMWVSCVIAQAAAQRGGLGDGCGLYHAALAALGDTGILLAAPGGTGKSTASARLPSPWRSLCDDTCFVVPAVDGGWVAHPWPTWSQFVFGGSGGSWPVGDHIAVRAVFFLEQAEADSVDRLGQGETTVRLYAAAEQARGLVLRALAPDERQVLRARWFAGAARLAATLPGYRLRLTLHGRFWELIEAELNRVEERVAR